MTKPEPTEARRVVWFSCGAASACAAKLAIEAYGEWAESTGEPMFMAPASIRARALWEVIRTLEGK